MTFTKEAIAIIAFIFGAVVTGSYAYVQEEQQKEEVNSALSSVVGSLPACVPKVAGAIDDKLVLKRIIAWGEMIAPRMDAAAGRVEDEKISELLALEAKRLREDARQAKTIYETITNGAYVADYDSLGISLPMQDGYEAAIPEVLPDLLGGYVNFAQREIYTAATASALSDVRSIGRSYLAHAGEVMFALNEKP